MKYVARCIIAAVAYAALVTPGLAQPSLPLPDAGTGSFGAWIDTYLNPILGTFMQRGAAAGGDLAGNFPNPSVLKLNGVAVTGGAPAAGALLQALSPTSAQWLAAANFLPDPAVFGAAVIQSGLQATLTPAPLTGCVVDEGGSLYSATPGFTLGGNNSFGGTGGGTITFTVSGGVVTACGASGGSWAGVPAVKVTDSTGSGAAVHVTVTINTLNVSAGVVVANGLPVQVASAALLLPAAGSGAFGFYCLFVDLSTGAVTDAAETSSGCIAQEPAGTQAFAEVPTSASFGGGVVTNAGIIAYHGVMRRAGQAAFDFWTTSKDWPAQTGNFYSATSGFGPAMPPSVCAMGSAGVNNGCMFFGNYQEWFSTDIQPVNGDSRLDVGPVLTVVRINTARTQENGDLLFGISASAMNGNTSGVANYSQILTRVVSVGTPGNSYLDTKGAIWFGTSGPDSALMGAVPRFELGSGFYAADEKFGAGATCGQLTTPSGSVAMQDMGPSTINLCGGVTSNTFGNHGGYYLDNRLMLADNALNLYGSTAGNPFFGTDNNGSVGLNTLAPWNVTGLSNSFVVRAGQNSPVAVALQNVNTGGSAQTELSMQTGTANSTATLSLTDATNVVLAGGTGLPLILKFDGGYSFSNGAGSVIWAQLATGLLSLGQTGVLLGQLEFFNTVSGNITVKPPAGALGTVSLTLPDVTSTLACLACAETFTAGQTIQGASFGLTGNISAPAWTTSGIRYANAASTLTDTTSSGTVATAYTDVWGGNTIAANSAVTFTNYYGAYFKAPIAGSNVTLPNGWALGADSAALNGPFLFSGASAYIACNAANGSPALANGVGIFNCGTSGGASFQGQGSLYDVQFFNKSSGRVFALPTGTLNLDIFGALIVGGAASSFTVATGEVAMAKIAASGSAPGAGAAKMEWVAGTNAGSCKLIAYAGTSNTPVTIIDNVGNGC